MSLWHKLSRVRDYAGFELSDLRDAVHYFGAGLYKSPFNLEAYRKGWKDHQPYQADGADAALVERLLRAYEKAKKDERDAPPLYLLGIPITGTPCATNVFPIPWVPSPPTIKSA